MTLLADLLVAVLADAVSLEAIRSLSTVGVKQNALQLNVGLMDA